MLHIKNLRFIIITLNCRRRWIIPNARLKCSLNLLLLLMVWIQSESKRLSDITMHTFQSCLAVTKKTTCCFHKPNLTRRCQITRATSTTTSGIWSVNNFSDPSSSWPTRGWLRRPQVSLEIIPNSTYSFAPQHPLVCRSVTSVCNESCLFAKRRGIGWRLGW